MLQSWPSDSGNSAHCSLEPVKTWFLFGSLPTTGTRHTKLCLFGVVCPHIR